MLAILSLPLLAASCQAPSVSVRHELPAAVAMPAGPITFTVGEFRADANAPTSAADTMRRILQRRLGSSTSAAGNAVEVSGTVSLRVTDMRHDALQPSLVRRVEARVDCVLQQDNRRLGVIEVRRSYNSAADPNVCGALGLERADDPARVPPAEKVVPALLEQCADVLVRMVTPVFVMKEIRLRPYDGPAAQKGFAAASEKRYREAMFAFQAALPATRDGSPAAHFNLAASAEAAGDLLTALEHYQSAAKSANGVDKESDLAVERVRQVIERQKLTAPESPSPAKTRPGTAPSPAQ